MDELRAAEQINLRIGVEFGQQEKGDSGVVDGVITQESIKIVIETKLEHKFMVDQLMRHLETIKGNYSGNILLALSKNVIAPKKRAEIVKLLRAEKHAR